MAQPSYSAVGTPYAASTTPSAVDNPADVAGELWLTAYSDDNGAATITVEVDDPVWSVGNSQSNVEGIVSKWHYKARDGGEGASTEWTSDSAVTAKAGLVFALGPGSGTGWTSPIVDHDVASGVGTEVTGPTVTATGASMLIAIFVHDAAAQVSVAPADMTLIAITYNAGVSTTIAAYYRQVSAGDYMPTLTWDTSDGWHAYAIVIESDDASGLSIPIMPRQRRNTLLRM